MVHRFFVGMSVKVIFAIEKAQSETSVELDYSQSILKICGQFGISKI